MANVLYRLGRWSFRAKWLVISVWLTLLAIVGGLSMSLQQGFNDIFSIKDTPGALATELYIENFPELKSPMETTGVNIVFAAPEGEKLTDPKHMETMDAVVAAINDKVEGVTNTVRFGNPVEVNEKLQTMIIEQSTSAGLPQELAEQDAANMSLVSEDERIAYTSFDFDVDIPAHVTDEQREEVDQAMQIGRDRGLKVEAGGAGFGEPIVIESTSEIIGLGIAAIVLIFTFGSLIAAGLPLVIALVGVGLGSLLVVMATAWLPLNNVTPVLAVMLGLAVGIDYSLFILFRYRRERFRMGLEQAAGLAVGTAGSAVVFAGLTVIIALVALAIANIPFLTYMGFAAAITVALAVLVALTLVPAILGVLGNKAFAGKVIPKRRRSVYTGPKRTMGRRWVELVHRAPAVVIVASLLGLGALTVPALQLHLSLPSDTQSDLETTQRKSADLMAEGFGAGINSPFLLVVDAHDADPEATVLQPVVRAQRDMAEQNGEEFDPKEAAAFATFSYIQQKYAVNQGVHHVQIIGQSSDGFAAQMLITPESSPEDPATNELISALRLQQPAMEDATGARMGITGLVPVQQDVTNRLASVLPTYLAIVVGLAILLLMVIFRSVAVPVVAGVGFLLSVGAAFGVTVMVWQEGLGGLVGTPGPIIAFMPIFLIGVCFGLAMDYQVFLVSAMREHYTHTKGEQDPNSDYTPVEASVIEGFAASARVVTAAAIIMIAVFVAFIGQPIPFIKIFGFSLGAGVLFDAFVIRMAFVPAAMFLLGRATWYMPRWLDKLLPRLDVEGSALEQRVRQEQQLLDAHRRAVPVTETR